LNAPDLKRVPILDHPLEFLAFLHLQSCGQRCRTDEIVLAILTAPLNHLQFGKVSHAFRLALSLVLGKTFFHSFSGAPGHRLRNKQKAPTGVACTQMLALRLVLCIISKPNDRMPVGWDLVIFSVLGF
jgi:hypothetical protein